MRIQPLIEANAFGKLLNTSISIGGKHTDQALPDTGDPFRKRKVRGKHSRTCLIAVQLILIASTSYEISRSF